ncbi:hypothetical protein EYF80_033576 [Liparis tanakae]|uniref:Uncharacterized protein n=1 Tax=Liparis tanakae TaxID=230148 RepID=A0A4Z2GSH7_9TELE|nr:hypothetical protein EYF80_033576 [Liparis tanakae]
MEPSRAQSPPPAVGGRLQRLERAYQKRGARVPVMRPSRPLSGGEESTPTQPPAKTQRYQQREGAEAGMEGRKLE